MMTEKISRRDRERLCAYLDQQLSDKESARLAARLQADKALQATLNELQTTRNMLKQLPHLKAPRNFTLTSEMVGVRKPQPSRLYPVFRLASVLSVLLFAITVVGDFAGIGSMAPQQAMIAPAMAPAAEAVAEESAEAATVADDAYADVEAGVFEAQPAAEMEAVTFAEGAAADEEAPAEKASGDLPELPSPVEETETQERELVPTLQPDATPEAAIRAEPVSAPSGVLWLPLLKVILGAAVVVTTSITFYLRQRAR